MADDDTPVPFAQRKSQNLHFKDFAKDTLFWASLPILGGVVTFIGGRISREYFNNKLWPLDGSPTIFQTLWEKGFNLFTKNTLNTKVPIGEVERLSFINHFWPEEKRLNVTRDIWNFMKGTELAIIPTAFHFWRRSEKLRLDLQPAHDRLEKLGAIAPTNEELRADNKLLAQEIEFLDKQAASPSAHLTGHKQHQGKLVHPEHHHAVAN